MKLVAKIKLSPSEDQRKLMLAAMERFNEACNWLAERAFALKTANFIKLHHAYYAEMRGTFSLPSAMAQLVIDKVIDAYTRDKSKQPKFKPHSSIAFDHRNYTFKSEAEVSFTCLNGRAKMAFVWCDHHRKLLEGERTQADLVLRKGRWYFFVTVETAEAAPIITDKFLGVDLGIINLATDSDGIRHRGASVEKIRIKLHALRKTLQKCGTRSAHRHLRRIGCREANFRADINHCISKAIVAKAKGTCRSIGLEDLTHIRDRVTVSRQQRARHSGWAFFQLRSFISYKAKRSGVVVVLVDPRNTSRTCTACGHCEEANRKTQAEFVCKKCGFVEHADVVGAINIMRRAIVTKPIVSSVDAKIPKRSGFRGAQKQASASNPPRI